MSKTVLNPAWHRKRQRAEKRFRWYGRAALMLAVIMLVVLLGDIISRGYSGFFQSRVRLTVALTPQALGLGENDNIMDASVSNYQRLALESFKSLFPDVKDRSEQWALADLLSSSAGIFLKRAAQEQKTALLEIALPLSSVADLYLKGKISAALPESDRKIKDNQITWLNSLKNQGRIQTVWNDRFFTSGDSRTPEQAGFLGAMAGSAFTLAICLLIAFPLGVMTAVYLEEFARKGRFVDIIEVNINNLAAVPSIVFGLLGLAVYINVMGLPRSAPLVGGMTLALMILPVIIITTRASLKAIPGSIRQAALALGASPLQVVWHHTLPLAMPGIMTGTILGMARAIGETAPLLMIGMVAFVADIPTGFTSPATAMPVQIYLWASSPEAGFIEKTAAGILVLLVLLLAMNALAIYLRKRFEVRW